MAAPWQTCWWLLLMLTASVTAASGHQLPRRTLAAVSTAATPSTQTAPSSRVENLVLYHKPPTGGATGTTSATGTPINFTVYYPSGSNALQQQQLPILFLFNGANVESYQYSTLADHLNRAGYTFVASDYYQDLPPELVALQNSSRPAGWSLPAYCPAGKILVTTAALIQTFVQYAGTSQNQAIKDVSKRGLVLISHSAGGSAATDIMSEACLKSRPVYGLDSCQGYQPPLKMIKVNSSCGGSSSGSGGGSSRPGLIWGVVAYEGYKSNQAPGGAITPYGINVPPGVFQLYLGSGFNNNARLAFELSNASSCACVGYANFTGLSHYGVTNYQGPGNTSRQITRCGRPGTYDPKNFTVTISRQEQGLQDMAQLIDTFIRASILQDKAARQALLYKQSGSIGSSSGAGTRSTAAGGQQQQQLPHSNMGYSLKLKQQCFQ